MKLHLPKSILAAILAVLASPAQAETRTYTGNVNKEIDTSDYDTVIFQMSGGGTNNYFSSAQDITCTTNAAIIIQDAANTDQVEGLIINNGHVNNVQIFKGALSGDGLLQKTGYGSPNTIVFEGDTSGFTGSIDLSSDSTFTLVFGGNSEAVAAATSDENTGIIGSGVIIYNSADNADTENSDNSDSPLLQTLRFNYAASNDNKPVFITNSIEDKGKGISKLELSGGADYTLTKEVTVDELSISAGVATFSQDLSVGSISGGGDVVLADGCTLTVGRTTGTIAADITGAVSLIKSESTSTTLSGNNSFTGGTSVEAGTLIVDSAAALAGAVTVDENATLQFNANPTAACDITLNGKLSLTWINTDSFVSQLSINDATFYSSANSTGSKNDGYAQWINPVVFNGNIYLGETGSIDTENLSLVDNKLICSGTFTKRDTFYVNSSTFQIIDDTDISAPTFHVTENAGLDINGKALAYKTIQLDAGATLTNTGNAVGVGLQQIQDITLNGNASVTATDGKEFGILGSEWGSTTMHLNEQILTKEGAGTFFLVNTTVSGGGKIAVAEGTLQIGCDMTSGTAINSETTEFAIADGAQLLLAYSSNLSAAGISGAGSITKTGDISTTLTLAGSGEYTFSGSIAEQIAINKTGSGHQLLTDSNTISSLTMTAGSLTLGSDGAEITLSTGTVTNGGTVNLAGNFTISGALSDYEFASSAGVEYSVAGTSNGFKTTRGDSYYLFKGGSGSVAEGMNTAIINLSSASQLSGSATLYATEGGIVFTFGGSNTTNDFYVQEGTVNQSTLLNDESYGVTAATGYIVTSGGTLELSQSSSGIVQLAGGSLVLTNNQSTDMTDGAIQVTDSASSVKLEMGVTLNYGKFSTTEGAAASLTGSGTLLVSNGEVGDSLSSVNLTSEEWTGILHLQGITTPTGKTGGVNLDNIAGNSSLLVLDGVSGFLSCEGNTSYTSVTLKHETNLKLQGDGLTLNDGFTHITHRFTGEISGSGALTMSGPPSHILVFSDKTSDWTGKISLKSDSSETESFVTFSGTSEINNESISADSGTLNLTISAPGQVDVKSSLKENKDNGGKIRLTVNAGTNAALTSSDISVDAVDNAGNLSFTGIQSLNLSNLTAADGSVLSVGSGVATIAAESTDTFTGVTVSGTAVLEGGSTINGSLDLSEADSLKLNNMDEAININGDLILVLGENETVSGNYTEMLENLIDGQSLDIFRVSGSITLNGLELTDGYSEDAGSLIAAIGQGRYSLGYRASATDDGGTLYLSTASAPAVPEPTTATLSLLALAAMAARRRRK